MRREIVTIPVLAFIISVMLAVSYDDMQRSELRNEQWIHTQHESEILHMRSQHQLDVGTKPIAGMVRWIEQNPDLSEQEFTERARQLLAGNSLLSHIAWMPGMVVTYLYPLQGNESVIGLDVAAHPQQRIAALAARDRRDVVTSSPIALVQGGRGVVVRAPVFVKGVGGHGDRFLGLVSAVIKIDNIIETTSLDSSLSNAKMALRVRPDNSGVPTMLYGEPSAFNEGAVIHELRAPGEQWQLAVQILSHQYEEVGSLLLGRILSVVVVLVLTVLTALIMLNHYRRIESEAKQRQEKEFIDSVLDTVGNVICVMNNRGKIIRFNHEAELVTGYRAEELIGTYVWENLIPVDQVEGVRKVVDSLVAGNFPNKYINHWKCKDSALRQISWSNTALLDAQGGVEFVVATGIDITETEQLQAQLRQAQKMEAIGQLTGGVAHDFNNILAAIIGNAELATMRFAKQGEGKLALYLDEITRSALRAKKLVSQMLAFTRDEKLPTKSVNLHQVIESFLLMLTSMIPSTIEIKTDFQEVLPEVLADDNQLDQVLLNLAINARDAMGSRGQLLIDASVVSVSSVCSSCHEVMAGEYVVLSVTDSAGSLAPEIVENIFNPFFTTKEVGKGSGMGLSMVHGIVHGWGGHIDVDVVPGVSTAFHLYIPLAR